MSRSLANSSSHKGIGHLLGIQQLFSLVTCTIFYFETQNPPFLDLTVLDHLTVSQKTLELQLPSCLTCKTHRASLVAQLVKNPPAMKETSV